MHFCQLYLFFRHPFSHSDGSGRAYKAAQMASDAFLSDDARFAVLVERDSLVSAVLAGDIAPSASDTFVSVNLGEDHRVAVQVTRQDDILQLLAHQFLQLHDAAFLHIVLQTEDEVINDAVTVLHHSGAYLYVTTAKLDELQRVAPCLNAADTADVHMFLDAGFVQYRVAGHLINHA